MSTIEERLAVLEHRVATLETVRAAAPAARPASAPGAVATDYDLDGKYGDEEIRRDPPRWEGAEKNAGKKMSDCSAEYLDELASFFDWQADKDEEKGGTYTAADGTVKQAKPEYKRKSAARARGWAARKRSGWKPKTNGGGLAGAAVAVREPGDDSDAIAADGIPF